MGGLTKRTATQQIPKDISGMRGSNIDFLNTILFGQGTPGQRVERGFGSLAPEGISQFLNQPTPEQRAMDISMPALQEILTPGANNPAFEQDLAKANAQGGRFGSANAILRSNALAEMFRQRTTAASTLGVLGQGAGAGQARQAGFMDLEPQRRLQILLHLLGVSQGASFNVPFVQQPSTLDSIGQLGAIIASFIPGTNPGGGAGPGGMTGGGGRGGFTGSP